MKIFFASDHAGYELKRAMISALAGRAECVDVAGTSERCDYPDSAAALAAAMAAESGCTSASGAAEQGGAGAQNSGAIGVVICGSGLGISMAANRFSHIRAALCDNCDLARLARAHNDANVLALGARFIALEQALCVLEAFIAGGFEGGRHALRVGKLSALGASCLSDQHAANLSAQHADNLSASHSKEAADGSI